MTNKARFLPMGTAMQKGGNLTLTQIRCESFLQSLPKMGFKRLQFPICNYVGISTKKEQEQSFGKTWELSLSKAAIPRSVLLGAVERCSSSNHCKLKKREN